MTRRSSRPSLPRKTSHLHSLLLEIRADKIVLVHLSTTRRGTMLQTMESMYHCCPYIHHRPCDCLSHETSALNESPISVCRVQLGVSEGQKTSKYSTTDGLHRERTIQNMTPQDDVFTPRLQRPSAQSKCHHHLRIFLNISTRHRLSHLPLAGFRNRRRGTRSQRILRYHSGGNWPYILVYVYCRTHFCRFSLSWGGVGISFGQECSWGWDAVYWGLCWVSAWCIWREGFWRRPVCDLIL